MDEDPQEHRFASWRLLRLVLTEHPGDLGRGVADSKLVHPLAERLQPFGADEVDAALRQHVLDRSVERCELEVREIVDLRFDEVPVSCTSRRQAEIARDGRGMELGPSPRRACDLVGVEGLEPPTSA